MKKIAFWLIGITAGLVLLAVLTVWQFPVFSSPDEPVTETEAKKLVQDRFEGEIIDSSLKEDVYTVSIQMETGKYDVKIDRPSGDLLGVTRVEKAETSRTLSEEEVIPIIRKAKAGDITNIKERADGEAVYYDAVVEEAGNKTYLTVDGSTGKIVQEREEKIEPPPVVARNITEAEAVEIALGKVYGEVDDVDFEEKNGQWYYFVEIELADDREATIQIHAISGEIKSIAWDD